MNKIAVFIKELFLDYKLYTVDEQIMYGISIKSELEGFFAVLRIVLDYCCYADENGFIPYIKYSKDTLYSERYFFLGTNNPFEYYFEQPAMKVSNTFMCRRNMVKCKSKHIDEIELKYNQKLFSYLTEDSYIEKMSYIYGKYISLNKMTDHKIKKSMEGILKEKCTLGIHIRGTDFYKEFNNHPVPVTVDEYINVIKEEMEKGQYEQIFVATDDRRCLKELKEKIHVPIIYYKNTMRTSNNKSVVFERNKRKNNNYLLGLEVLKDAYTLAACDGFVGCLSQIDIFVRIIKKSKGQEFVSLKIINKGIFNNNRQCWEPAK